MKWKRFGALTRLRKCANKKPAVLIVSENDDDARLVRSTLEKEGIAVAYCHVEAAAELTRSLSDSRSGDGALIPVDAGHLVGALGEPTGRGSVGSIFPAMPRNQASELTGDGTCDRVSGWNPGQVGGEAHNGCGPFHRKTRISHACRFAAIPEWRRMCAVLDQLLRESRKDGSRLAVVTFDVDRLHRINLGFGYEKGDRLLRSIGERFARASGTALYLGRMRGDEYLVVLAGFHDRAEVETRVTDLIAVIQRPFYIDGIEIIVTVSAGVSLFPDHGEAAAELVRDAETTMLEAKQSRRGHYKVASLLARHVENVRLEHQLHRALERKQLRLEYQPQLELRSGSLIGFEALLRWHHPELGRLLPARFIALAEESGEISRIGEWVLRTACRDAATWHRMPGGSGLRVAVNFSAGQFLDKNAVDLVRRVLGETQLPPNALELELTESVLISDVEAASSRLDAFRALGVRTSVDDFGTGYSSLSYLSQFALDVLKIDRSFVTELTKGARAASVISALINLGRSLGMELIAEGVETEEQAETLLGFGCHAAQGFFFGKAASSQEVQSMLRISR